MSARNALPPLPLEPWEATKETLHLWAQIVGKVRLASVPPSNHWWHAPLYVTERGLTTRRMTHRAQPDARSYAIDFDFWAHELLVRTDTGELRRLPLRDGISVQAFYRWLMATLSELDLSTPIVAKPFGLATAITPFDEDIAHASYDPEAVGQYWAALRWVDTVLAEFSGWFYGKTSPVHLFWHSFDLVVTRFSDRRVLPVPGVDRVTADAYSHEVISFGFWPGDRLTRRASFYSYTAPEPPQLDIYPLEPAAARWQLGPTGTLARLDYEAVRTADDPRATLLAFLSSAYDAGATAAGWKRTELMSVLDPRAGAADDNVTP